MRMAIFGIAGSLPTFLFHGFWKQLIFTISIFVLYSKGDRLFTKEDLLDKCIAVMKISVPRSVLWQNLKNLKAITLTNTVSKDKKVSIQAISDKELNSFLEKALPAINLVLDFLKDKQRVKTELLCNVYIN